MAGEGTKQLEGGMGTAEGSRRRIREPKPPSDDLIQEFVKRASVRKNITILSHPKMVSLTEALKTCTSCTPMKPGNQASRCRQHMVGLKQARL